MDYFKGWSDKGEFLGPSFDYVTELPFDSPDMGSSKRAKITFVYRHFEIGIEQSKLPTWADFLNELRTRIETSFANLLAIMQLEIEI